jgi:acyl-CoA thioesterase I
VLSRLLSATLSIAVMMSFNLYPASAKDAIKIVAFGDSLSAGYGVAPEESFPAQLEKKLRQRGHNVTVANAGVSGDTTAGGKARLAWVLQGNPDIVIVELGANDALRGLPPANAHANLDAILQSLHEKKIKILLAGMKAPPNLGMEYSQQFNSIYPALAKKYDVPLYPFFLDKVAGNPSLNLGDSLHPNAKGIAIIVEGILPEVEKLLD